MNKIIRISIPFMIAFLFISLLIWLAGASSQVTAAPSLSTTEGTILVTTLEDELNTDGDCSLREALKAANTNAPVDACPAGSSVLTDTITFDVVGNITVTSVLSVTAGGPLVVDGGNAIATINPPYYAARIWWVEPGSEVTLQNMTVKGGFVWQSNGSGLYNNGGHLTINHCYFLGNTIYAYWWQDHQYYYGGGIYSAGGTINVTDSFFEANGSGNQFTSGGAIALESTTGSILHSTFLNNYSQGCYDVFCEQPGGGAIYLSNSDVIIQDSLFLHNSSVLGGALVNSQSSVTIQDSSFISNTGGTGYQYGGGIVNYYGTMTLTNSTVSDNTAGFGGGIHNNTGTLTVTNTTISGNTASQGGAVYNSWGTLTLINSTLTGNSANLGGAIYHSYGSSMAINSILANSILGGDCASWSGGTIDGGHNISSDDSCSFDPANGSMPNTDPLLGPLHDNGGPTLTHALLWNSPAIDLGDNNQCPSTDQRGMPRPIDGNMDGNPVCDIGSYELISVSPTLVTISGANQGFVMHAYTFTAVVDPISTTQPLTYTWQASNQASITHTDGLTDTLGFTWEVTGTQSITVTASNPFGSISATHSIIITTPYEIYLPLVKKSSAPPLGSFPTYSLSGGGVFMGLVIIGMVGRWKRRRLL